MDTAITHLEALLAQAGCNALGPAHLRDEDADHISDEDADHTSDATEAKAFRPPFPQFHGLGYLVRSYKHHEKVWQVLQMAAGTLKTTRRASTRPAAVQARRHRTYQRMLLEALTHISNISECIPEEERQHYAVSDNSQIRGQSPLLTICLCDQLTELQVVDNKIAASRDSASNRLNSSFRSDQADM